MRWHLYKKVPLEFVNNSNNGSNEWISAMKIIAYVYSSLKNNNNDNDTSSYIFSQWQLSDFLTLSAKGIEEKIMSSEIINSIIFKIYRDITENYQELSKFKVKLPNNYCRCYFYY